MPTSEEWLEVTNWGKKYGARHRFHGCSLSDSVSLPGDVVYVENLGQPLIFINTYKAAFELLDKKSSIYSDRPRLPMLGEL